MERLKPALSVQEIQNTQTPSPIDLLTMNREQETRILSRLRASQGTVRIFIHPFYERYTKSHCFSEHNLNPKFYPRISTVPEGIARILSLPPARTPPVIIFEESARLMETANWAAEISTSRGNEAYMVATHDGSPQPKFSNKAISRYDNENWDKIIDLFKRLCVSTIIIGGSRLTMSFIHNSNFLDPTLDSFRKRLKNMGAITTDINFDRCVGEAIAALSTEFNIVLSALTHPHSRIDLNALAFHGIKTKYDILPNILLYVLQNGLDACVPLDRNPFR